MTQAQDTTPPFFRQRIVVLAAGFVAMLLAAAGAWLIWRALPEVPVREVRFVNAGVNAFSHVNGDDLTRIARAVAATRVSVLRTDLADVKAAVEQVDWVRRADVRRQLPDSIEVKIEEQVPFGIWRNATGPAATPPTDTDSEDMRTAPEQLINRFGEVFKGTLPGEQQAALPVLIGPPEAAKEVLAGFEQFGKQLSVIERAPRELQLSMRRAWTIRLDNGMTLEIGRSDAELRLVRFIHAYRQVAALQTAGAHLDLRYQNGLAIRTTSAATPALRLPAVTKAHAKMQIKKPTKMQTRANKT